MLHKLNFKGGKMINRAIIIVLDGFGVGEAPDAKNIEMKEAIH